MDGERGDTELTIIQFAHKGAEKRNDETSKKHDLPLV